MPSVTFRDGYLTSRNVAKLESNFGAEVLYLRLLLVIDSKTGRIDKNPSIVRNLCFPLNLSVTEEQVSVWLLDLVSAGLIVEYDADIEVLKHATERKKGEIADDSDSVFPFKDFWDAYGKKTGLVPCRQAYARICEDDRSKIKDAIEKYVRSTPDVQFRKNPLTWLHQKGWNDEYIISSSIPAIIPDYTKKGF